MYLIQNEAGEWVEGTPTLHGQPYREVKPSGVIKQSIWEVLPPLMPIVLNKEVTGLLPGFDDGPNEFTCQQNTEVVMTAPLAVPDQYFRIPALRTDTGREVPIFGQVVNHVLTIRAVFPTGGYWVCNQELINRDLPAPMFSMDELNFTVM